MKNLLSFRICKGRVLGLGYRVSYRKYEIKTIFYLPGRSKLPPKTYTALLRLTNRYDDDMFRKGRSQGGQNLYFNETKNFFTG